MKLVQVLKYYPTCVQTTTPTLVFCCHSTQSKLHFFFPQGDFYNQKKQQLNQQHQNIHFIIWFLLWQCSSTLASWASRKLMSLMKRQSKDLRLFLKVFLVLFWGFLHQKLLNLSCSFVCFHVAAFYFSVDRELHTYMISSMYGVKTSNFIADKCWTKVEMWCWRSFQSLIRTSIVVDSLTLFFPSENNCYFPLQFQNELKTPLFLLTLIKKKQHQFLCLKLNNVVEFLTDGIEFVSIIPHWGNCSVPPAAANIKEINTIKYLRKTTLHTSTVDHTAHRAHIAYQTFLNLFMHFMKQPKSERLFTSVILRHPKHADNKVVTPLAAPQEAALWFVAVSFHAEAPNWGSTWGGRRSPLVTGEHHRRRLLPQQHVQTVVDLPEIQTRRTSERTAQVSWFLESCCAMLGAEEKEQRRSQRKLKRWGRKRERRRYCSICWTDELKRDVIIKYALTPMALWQPAMIKR